MAAVIIYSDHIEEDILSGSEQPYGLPCSLAVQWLRLCAFTAEGMGSITDWGTKIAHEGWWGRRESLRNEPIFEHMGLF